MKQLHSEVHRVSAFGTLTLTLASVFLPACSRPQPIHSRQEGPLPVRAAVVKSRQVQRTVESVGTLFPYDETVVSAEIDGRILEVRADLGDRVNKGEPLVLISDEEQRYLLQQTEAQLRMTLERLGLPADGTGKADIRETSDVRRAQADLFDAEQRYKRVRSLVDEGVGSQQDLDQAQARFKAAQAAYDQAVNQVRNLLQEVERSRASLALQKKKLRDTTVYAPFGGAVKERQVAQGTYVRANTPLLTLVKVDPIRLRIEVPERMAPWIRTGQVAQVTLEAFGERKFHGRIWRISPTVDQSKRTFVVEALIDNPQGELKPGSYARAHLETSKVEQINVMPAQGVNYVLGSNKAYLIRDGVVDAREIKLGDRFENEVEVVEGLVPGDTVAVSQLQRLDTGTKVTIQQDSKTERASSN